MTVEMAETPTIQREENPRSIEWFVGRPWPRRLKKEARLTLSKLGAALLNRFGYEQLGGPSHLRIGFARHADAVVIRAVDGDAMGGFAVSHGKDSVVRFGAKRFCDQFGIHYPIKLTGHRVDDMLVFPLSQKED